MYAAACAGLVFQCPTRLLTTLEHSRRPFGHEPGGRLEMSNRLRNIPAGMPRSVVLATIVAVALSAPAGDGDFPGATLKGRGRDLTLLVCQSRSWLRGIGNSHGKTRHSSTPARRCSARGQGDKTTPFCTLCSERS